MTVNPNQPREVENGQQHRHQPKSYEGMATDPEHRVGANKQCRGSGEQAREDIETSQTTLASPSPRWRMPHFAKKLRRRRSLCNAPSLRRAMHLKIPQLRASMKRNGHRGSMLEVAASVSSTSGD